MNAFSQRLDLVEADIPEGIKIIEKGAFASSRLQVEQINCNKQER